MRQLIRKLLLLWDPDFTKATITERLQMAISEKQYKKGIFYSEKEVYDE